MSQDYFPKHIALPLQLLKQVQNLQHSLAQKIQTGQIQISRQQKLTNFDKNDKHQVNEEYRKRIKQLDIIKQQLANKLKQIDSQQKQIKVFSRRIQRQKNKSKLERSVLTEEDRYSISMIKRQQRQFQISIKKKISNVIDKIKQDEKSKLIQKSFKNDLHRKQRLVNLQKKRKQLKQSRQKKIQTLQRSQLTVQPQSYSYLQNEMKEKKIQQERAKYTEMLLQSKKQKMRVDYKQIKQHGIEFKKLMEQNKQAHLLEMKENQIQRRSKTITYQSQFTKKVKEEKKLQIIQRMRQKNAKKQIRQRIINFNQYLSESFKPKVTQQSAFIARKQSEPLQQLSHSQKYSKGIEYLELSKKKGKKLSPSMGNQRSLQNSSKQERLETSSTQKYPNYLIQFRKKSKKQTKSIFQRVMKQKKITARKVEQVIKWMKSKQQGQNIGNSKKNNLYKQLQTAFQKIQLLNSIYDNQEQVI